MRIFINGVEKSFYEERISLSFEDLTKMAEIPHADAVVYKHAHYPKDEGILSRGDRVTVKHGTVVNVASTGNA